VLRSILCELAPTESLSPELEARLEMGAVFVGWLLLSFPKRREMSPNESFNRHIVTHFY
jgi:hypothetical protein